MKICTWKNQVNVTFDKDTPSYGCVGIKWPGRKNLVLFVGKDGKINFYDEKKGKNIYIGQVPNVK